MGEVEVEECSGVEHPVFLGRVPADLDGNTGVESVVAYIGGDGDIVDGIVDC